MPRDSSGNYTLPAGNPVVSGDVISSSGWGNPTMSDIATELTNSLDRSGRGGMLAAFKFADGTAGAPGLTFTNEPTSGFFRAGTADVEVSIAGVPQMRWTGTGVDVWDSGTSTWLPITSISSLPITGGTITGNLLVTGTLGAGATTVTTLHATGAADFDSTFNADGAATFVSTVNITGATTLTTLHATGAVDFDTTLNVDGAATLATIELGHASDTTLARIAAGRVSIEGVEIGWRQIPKSATTSGTLTAAEVGKMVPATAGITINNSVFSAGDCVSIYNDSSSSITITQGSGVTLRLVGTATTGNRTLAQRGVAVLWFNSASEAVCTGVT